MKKQTVQLGSQTAFFPRWFFGLLVVVATVMLSACRAPESRITSPTATQLPNEVLANQPAGMPMQAPMPMPQLPPQPHPQTQSGVVPAQYVAEPMGAMAGCPSGDCMAPTAGVYPGCGPAGCQACGPCGPAVGGPDEYICDGGDFGVEAGVRKDWSVVGLEQEDTVVHYDTLAGQVVIQPSNRVCIYAPRFGAVRQVANTIGIHRDEKLVAILDEMAPNQAALGELAGTSLQRYSPIANLGDQPPSLYRGREQAISLLAPVRVMEVVGMIAPYCDFQIVELGIIDNLEKAAVDKQVQNAIAWTGVQQAQVVLDGTAAGEFILQEQPGQMYHLDGPDAPKIRLVKLASTDAAHPGDEVSFTLRFDNVGDQKIGNVTIIDHLSVRLEYVPDSAQSSVPADFGIEDAGDGSSILRWEIEDPVDVKEGGVLQFKARVR